LQIAVVNEERDAPLEGTAVFFFKLNAKKMLTEDNVHRDLMVGMLDASEGTELVANLIQIIRYVYQPIVENLLFFSDECPVRHRIFEEILMAIQSLCSSLKVSPQFSLKKKS